MDWQLDRMTNVHNMWTVIPTEIFDFNYAYCNEIVRNISFSRSKEALNEVIDSLNRDNIDCEITHFPRVEEIIRPIFIDDYKGFDEFWAVDEFGRIGRIMANESLIFGGWRYGSDPPEYRGIADWRYMDGTKITVEWD